MDLTIKPRRLAGRVTPPPSKSQAHRAVLAMMLAGGAGQLPAQADSQDIQATRRCVAALTAPGEGLPRLDCGESGSTLRFLIPVALALRGGGVFTGRGRLMERPLGPYLDLFDEKRISYSLKNGELTVRGKLEPGEYRLPGDVSSQFVTGLLYALPLLAGESEIVLTTPLQSRDYVFMTLEALGNAGVSVTRAGDRYLVPGGQKYMPHAARIEPDWSQAAFWFAAGNLGSGVEVEGLDPCSVQGDRVIAEHCARLSRPGGAEIDVSQCPDLAPPLAAAAAVRRGTARLTNAARLRLKESDRLSAIAGTLNALGAKVMEGPDFLAFEGVESLRGGTVDCRNDHRIAMMAAVAATRCESPVTLLGAECVRKSYPDFWEDYRRLGGEIHVRV